MLFVLFSVMRQFVFTVELYTNFLTSPYQSQCAQRVENGPGFCTE